MLLLAISTTASASLDKELIRRELRQAGPAVTKCSELHALPYGTYTFALTVVSSGAVSDVKLTSGPAGRSEAGEQCLRDAYRQVKFKPFTWGASFAISWPIKLAPPKMQRRDSAGRPQR